ncbi:MAG: nuclear transport factor 2 family protein [Acidimicrobiales bacterium]|nr:nuclear transport factor 2 family protein [Acidimicrobiales bacterium]
MHESDHDEIRNLLARLAQVTDTGEIDEYLDCFTADAVLEVPPGPPFEGRAALEQRARSTREEGRLGPGSHVRHALTTIVVTVDGDEATSRSVWQLIKVTGSGPELMRIGEYRDRLRRDGDGRWRLANRQLLAEAGA